MGLIPSTLCKAHCTLILHLMTYKSSGAPGFGIRPVFRTYVVKILKIYILKLLFFYLTFRSIRYHLTKEVSTHPEGYLTKLSL